MAEHFGLMGGVSTSSWLVGDWQGRGLGTLMRAMVLEFAFGSLGAEEATTTVQPDNLASARVSLSLGYRREADTLVMLSGRPQRLPRYRLTRADWRPRPEVAVLGVEACRGMLIGDGASAG